MTPDELTGATTKYPAGTKIDNDALPHSKRAGILTFHGEWNYTLHPDTPDHPPT